MDLDHERSPTWGLRIGRCEARLVETALLGILVLLVNAGLFTSRGVNEALGFNAAAFTRGEFWRALTYPLVHVSVYHLCLDAGAFLLLYKDLPLRGTALRVLASAFVTITSLAATVLTSPLLRELGLCGFSGPAHGLMIFSSLRLWESSGLDAGTRRIGLLTAAGTAAKCVLEVITGQPFLMWLHFGDIGTPLVACHAGGAIGGFLLWSATRFKRCCCHARVASLLTNRTP